MKNQFVVYLITVLLFASSVARSENVIEDGGVGMTMGELAYIVNKWPDQMQQAAANDVGDRMELLSKTMATVKLAREFEYLSLEEDGDLYYESIFMLRDAKRRFLVDLYLKKMQVPDMTKLAKERYLADKDKYQGLVPEQRISSHILFACQAGACEVEEKKALAAQVLKELVAGADFESQVEMHSEDAGTKAKNGRFERWVSDGDETVAAAYVKGLYEIEEVGGYSSVVESQFGFHIIRLDEIKASHYKAFEDVEPTIVTLLQREYRKRALIDYVNGFNITEDAYINGEAMDQIFDQYKTELATPAEP